MAVADEAATHYNQIMVRHAALIAVAATACSGGSSQPPTVNFDIAFVTSTSTPPMALGGLAGADAICAADAKNTA
ncbi:MAG TPA: hypothetical protein VMJ10_14715 [Kofleriaceae bacterium]|nr:hypothetical protein [Kofleriaceae bacterium]